MKMMKLALLGTAALAAVSVSARADDLSDLKAQIEALKADVAALQSAPSVPAGYQLMTMGEAQTIIAPTFTRDARYQSETASTVGILPTADVPASTNIQWDGFVRAGLYYSDLDYDSVIENNVAQVEGVGFDDPEGHAHIFARGRLNVTGTTDTAVGLVGATLRFEADYDGASKLDGSTGEIVQAWGWWQFTPEMSFGGGYTGSLTDVGVGRGDEYAGAVDGSENTGDRTQFRLGYASGPIGLTLAVNHADEAASDDDFGVEGALTYTGDTVGLTVAAGMNDDNWQGVAKVTASLDMFSIGLLGGVGQNGDATWGPGPLAGAVAALPSYVPAAGAGPHAEYDYWLIAGLIKASLSDSIKAEVAASYKSLDGDSGPAAGVDFYEADVLKIGGGVYYTPVSQLTLGVEAGWQNVEASSITAANPNDSYESTNVEAAFVSIFRF